MSIHFCEECKQAFLPEQTKTDGERLFCKKCNVKLINLGSEKGQISLRGHLESQYGKKQQQKYKKFALIESKHYTTPKPDQTLIECEALLSDNPLNTSALFTLCKWYFSKGLLDESVAIAKQITSIDPNFNEANEFIAQNSQNEQRHQLNLPEDIATLETMAINFFNNNNYEQAIETLQKILKINQKHPAAHRYLAEIYTNLSQYRQAVSHFNYLTLIYPNDYRVFYNFAVLCYQMNDFSRALSNLNQAYNTCHDDPEFLHNIEEMINHIKSL